MKTSTVIGLVTFTAAGTLCATFGVTYPVVIWGAGYAAIAHRKRHAAHVNCPLLEVAAARAKEEEKENVVASVREIG